MPCRLEGLISQRTTRNQDPELPVRRKVEGKVLWAIVRIAFASDRRAADTIARAERAIRTGVQREGAEVSVLGSQLLAQVSEGGAADSVLPVLRALGETVLAAVESQTGERPWVGVGSAHRQRDSIGAGSRQARSAIELSRAMGERPCVVLYEDVLPLAAMSADPALCERLGQILDPVASHDRRHGTSMMETLRVSIDRSWSMAAVARQLDVHRHTVEYRLRGIHRVLGYDVRRPADRFLLEAAVAARRLRRRG